MRNLLSVIVFFIGLVLSGTTSAAEDKKLNPIAGDSLCKADGGDLYIVGWLKDHELVWGSTQWQPESLGSFDLYVQDLSNNKLEFKSDGEGNGDNYKNLALGLKARLQKINNLSQLVSDHTHLMNLPLKTASEEFKAEIIIKDAPEKDKYGNYQFDLSLFWIGSISGRKELFKKRQSSLEGVTAGQVNYLVSPDLKKIALIFCVALPAFEGAKMPQFFVVGTDMKK